MVQKDKFIGTWRLESWLESDNHGNMFCPLKEDISGFLTFSPKNYTVVISGIEPELFKTLSDRNSFDHKHRSDLFSTILFHHGEYIFSHHELIYKIQCSNHHLWKGSHFHRYFKLIEQNRLQTSTPPVMKDGAKYISNLMWIRD